MTTKNLKRQLTAFNVWSLAFGCIIGFGCFVMPGTTFLKRAGTLGTLIAMEIAALIMLIVSYSYGYMIKKFPETGGEFIYARRAFGRTHGFICAWFLGLCYLCIIPMNATALCLIFRAVYGDLLQFGFHYKVAGYDIYFGEVLLALGALILFAYVNSLGVHTAGQVQSVFVVILLVGVFIILGGTFFSPDVSAKNLMPMFYPQDKNHGSALAQIISVLVVAPWAYVGFDTIPQLAEESNFSHNWVKSIMDTSILAGCFVYIVMTLIAASGIPNNFSSWVNYVEELPNLKGINGIATFSAANKILGKFGVFCVSMSALMAMLTGILGFYTATSRLLYSMARAEMIPSWFMTLNKNSVPMKAVIFCMSVSMFAPFVGRNALGWTVDMSSLGGAVSLAYTSLAAVHFARRERRTDMIIFGGVGFVFSVIFALLLLVPISWLNCSLEVPSYFLLMLWIFLGVIFFLNMNKTQVDR